MCFLSIHLHITGLKPTRYNIFLPVLRQIPDDNPGLAMVIITVDRHHSCSDVDGEASMTKFSFTLGANSARVLSKA